MKIAVFKYKISKCGGKGSGGGDCLNPELIEEEMNDFMEDKTVINIQQSTYTTDRHNNGGLDEVWLMYTIMYK